MITVLLVLIGLGLFLTIAFLVLAVFEAVSYPQEPQP